MFTPESPASRRGRAVFSRSKPLVVITRRSRPGSPARSPMKGTMSARKRGSPPVMRILRMPRLTAAAATASISARVRVSPAGVREPDPAGMQYRQRRLHRSVTERRR
jgi:hypothetical protein